MTQKIQSKVTEIEVFYKNKIKAIDRPKIHEPKDAYRIFESYWSNKSHFD